MQYSIGEFSKITRTSLKALRLYHEQDLLIPDFVDPESGYRYYADAQFYDLQVIQQLKLLGFSLREIKNILEECENEGEIIGLLNDQREKLNDKISQFQQAVGNIELILEMEKYAMNNEVSENLVEEKYIPDMLIAGHRMVGRYDEIGRGFGILGRAAGRRIKGPASCLFYDDCYRESDANFEPFFEVDRKVEKKEVECREIPGGKAVTFLHKGPYERLSDSYKQLMDAIKKRGLQVRPVSREVYLKGPGMIFKGDPEKYLTEIQFLIEEQA